MNVVLFCGGRGSASIIRALVRRSDIALTLLVNGYDDGQSTGALRSFIPGMLGPSDFRKNLSWLLASGAPYASLMEYRFPPQTAAAEIEKLARFTRNDDAGHLDAPLRAWFAQLPAALSGRLRALLGRFFDHAAGTAFDYRDCSLGNLVFAGAYLMHGNDFNVAVAEVSELVGSRTHLLNVAEGQNRILVALKQDGTFLASEAAIVAPQSTSRIAELYLLQQALNQTEQQALDGLDFPGKQHFLAARDAIPAISARASAALAQADVIVYGPGTQHSSLLPSYRIAATALAAAPAAIKALIVNLGSDHDIQSFSAGDIVDRAMSFGAPVTDILLDEKAIFPESDRYRGARILRGAFADRGHPDLHDGDAVVRRLVSLA